VPHVLCFSPRNAGTATAANPRLRPFFFSSMPFPTPYPQVVVEIDHLKNMKFTEH